MIILFKMNEDMNAIHIVPFKLIKKTSPEILIPDLLQCKIFFSNKQL